MTYTQFTPEEIEQYNSVVKLSILIATTKDRRGMFNTLMQEFNRQVDMGGFTGAGIEIRTKLVPMLDSEGVHVVNEDDGSPMFTDLRESFYHPNIVEVLFEEDEKEMSIGAKRQKLLERAKGDYIVYFDSDDFPSPEYVKDIMEAIEGGPDCVGFKIAMTTNGENPETCIHSLSNPEWTHDGVNYLRNVTHFNPVKRNLALQVGFRDMRFGEDKVYSDTVSKLCRTETFIDKYLFDYRYSNAQEHNLKYGITG